MIKYQNLHSHTTSSDGLITHQETLETCHENQVSVVAFTDHDSVPSPKTINWLNKNRSHPVKWVSGIEISSGFPKEISDEPAGDFHLVGLFINPLNKALLKYCQDFKEAAIKRAQKIVKNLQALGFILTVKDCEKEANRQAFQRPHIVRALFKKPANICLLNKLKEKMKKAGQKNPEINAKYQKMIREGRNQYPYRLFLSSHAFLKRVYVPHLYWVDLDKAVSLIRNAGGLAFLAHWTFCKNKISLQIMEKLLKEKRLDGLEIVYNAFVQGREKEILADMKKVERLAEKHHVFKSGGADSHSRQDIKGFYKDKKLAQKTTGLVQKIIKQSKIDTTWSSL